MQNVFVILPDFLVILTGCLLFHKLKYPKEFWRQTERLVFYVLFPPLLFLSVSQAKFDFSETSDFILVGVSAMCLAVVTAWLVRFFVSAGKLTDSSVFQCGFRFNTYIGFAICLTLFGQDGFSLFALLIAVWVPISNTIAVSALAKAVAQNRQKEKRLGAMYVLKTVLKNPLIIATVLGLVFNYFSFSLPSVAADYLRHLGNASLAMGLLCIGAGLEIEDIRRYRKLIFACTVQRLVIVPMVALLLVTIVGLSTLQAKVIVLFAALPTAQSCFVMTSSMGGDAASVADVTTSHTLCSMVTLPLWIAVYLG